MIRVAVIFALLAAGCVFNAMREGGSAWWLWPGVSFALLAIAYAGAGPMIFGKGADGRMSLWRGTLLLPYLLLTWIVWYVRRAIGREPVAHEVAPGIWLGRKPFARELPAGIECVVDLTSEFPGVRIPPHVDYIACPTLDYGAPCVGDMRAALDRIGGRSVYVHCAMGRGRSAVLAAALLVRRGFAADVYAATEMLRKARPCIRLTGKQMTAAAQATLRE